MARKLSHFYENNKELAQKILSDILAEQKIHTTPFSAAFGHFRVELSEIVLNIWYVIVEISTLSDLLKEALREVIKTNGQTANQSQTWI